MRHCLCVMVHVLTHARPCGVPYRNAVLLSIAQGWQVQLSLPWVTDADRGLPTTWVVLSFAHIITHPNETVGAVPACPPERSRSGVSIPRTCVLCVEILTMDAPLQGDTGGHIGTAPTHLHQTMRGVPLPHRGYTFDSAGLASATQPTLGNNVSEGATHNVGCTFFRPP